MSGIGSQGPLASLALAVRFSLREMRGGLSGFLIFIACIALGVGAIGGVNSVARTIAEGVSDQGQVLLGGDVRFELNQRQAGPEEQAFLDGLGTVSNSALMRSMARLADGSDQMLVELKAVDDAYPLYGALDVEPAECGHYAPGAHRGRAAGLWRAARALFVDRNAQGHGVVGVF